jgi:hypothetical protein
MAECVLTGSRERSSVKIPNAWILVGLELSAPPS